MEDRAQNMKIAKSDTALIEYVNLTNLIQINDSDISDEVEDNIPIPICTIDEIKVHEKKTKLRAQAFLKKHSFFIKRNLLLAGMNKKLLKD